MPVRQSHPPAKASFWLHACIQAGVQHRGTVAVAPAVQLHAGGTLSAVTVTHALPSSNLLNLVSRGVGCWNASPCPWQE